MKIQHSTQIDAPIERVWSLTVDIESWPEITPTVTSVERLDTGALMIGSRAELKQPGQGTKVWTVTELERGRRFAWSARLMGTRMTGRHLLAEEADGTRNTLEIEIEGKLAPLVGLLLRWPIGRALRQENAGFKAAAEGQPNEASSAASHAS